MKRAIYAVAAAAALAAVLTASVSPLRRRATRS